MIYITLGYTIHLGYEWKKIAEVVKPNIGGLRQTRQLLALGDCSAVRGSSECSRGNYPNRLSS